MDEQLEETKNHASDSAGLRGDCCRVFGAGRRGQNSGFATSQRSHSSSHADTDPDSIAECNSTSQPIGDNHSGDADSDSNTATHAPSKRGTNSD